MNATDKLLVITSYVVNCLYCLSFPNLKVRFALSQNSLAAGVKPKFDGKKTVAKLNYIQG